MTAPNGKNAKITYYENKAPIWVAEAAGLKVDPALAALLVTKAAAARTALNAQNTAIDAGKTATSACNVAVKEMADVGAEIMSQIRSTAKVDGDDIYILAGLPIPPAPSPVPPPGMPSNFKVGLLPNGTIELSWKCENPANAAGPLYHIYRREAPGTPWVFIAGTGEKKYNDVTVPSGVPHVYYQVQAARANSVGIANEFIVNFGVSEGGAMTATVTSAPKLAA